ncbi:MAG TPA: hypothetical protein VFP12_18095 [Allosphingosinicella sp.]|nr:hypothetical protein [Allosphingosinicella sp.]
MRFFVPYAADDEHAEAIWSEARSDLFDIGLPTTRRRIWALSLDGGGSGSLLHVGREIPEGEGPAMLIFEASNLEVYYVCTPWRGVLGGEPHVLGLRAEGRAIDFEAPAQELRARREAG